MAIYIVFSPQGVTQPVKVHDSHKQALGVAHRMAAAHVGQDFYVMKSASKAISVQQAEAQEQADTTDCHAEIYAAGKKGRQIQLEKRRAA